MRIDCGEEETDERLVQRMRRGDGLAFGTLTTRYWHVVHRICANLLPSLGEAREATEEIFVQASRAPVSLLSDAPVRTSLLRLALRLVLARRRSARETGAAALEGFLPRFDGEGRLAWAAPDRSALAGMAFNARDLRERVRDALGHLDELDHASFVLRDVERIPVDEAAAILEIPSESVSERTHRAALMLTGYLGELFAAPPAPRASACGACAAQ
jgi:DNA-directed RNA polymerase specialized sigma24 family protein